MTIIATDVPVRYGPDAMRRRTLMYLEIILPHLKALARSTPLPAAADRHLSIALQASVAALEIITLGVEYGGSDMPPVGER